jgi:hypothetical protein
MLLGRKMHGAGNKTRYEIDYSNWLEPGESLDSGTVVLDPEFTATVTDVVLTGVEVTPSHKLVFFMETGSVSESFTLDVQVITKNPTETKNDTVEFFIP